MFRKSFRLLSALLILILMFSVLSAPCLAITPINNISAAGVTEGIDGLDVNSSCNLFGDKTHQAEGNGMWIIDAKMEDSANCKNPSDNSGAIHPAALRISYSDEKIPAKGDYGLKVTRHVNFTLPYDKMEQNKYYVFSFYVYANKTDLDKNSLSCYIGTRSYSGCSKKYEGTACYDIANFAVGQWKKISLVFYTGNNTVWTFGIGTGASTTNYYYLDDFCLAQLPENVQNSAKALDECQDILVSEADFSDLQDLFCGNSVYSKLYSPFTGEKYSEICETLDSSIQIKSDYAQSGFGYKSYYDSFTASAEDNLIKNSDCSEWDYWKASSVNYMSSMSVSSAASYSGSTSLKFQGSGHYIKWLSVEKETEYYLSLYGMTPANEPVNDIHFGVVDANNCVFENILTAVESSNEVIVDASFQEISIRCQDGNWHNRSYKFNTGDNTVIGIFFKGSGGVMYFDDICVVKENNAIHNENHYTKFQKQNNSSGKFICESSQNIINNGFFDDGDNYWYDEYAFARFLNVENNQGNSVLHFVADKNNCYYIATFPVEKTKTYTFSYWAKIVSYGAEFGVVNGKKPFTYIEKDNAKVGEWQFHAVSFTANDDESVSFVIYDNAGEAYFDKFRLFDSALGNITNTYNDMPDKENIGAKISPTTPIDGFDSSNTDNKFLSSAQFSMKVPDYSFENSNSVSDITPYSQVKDNIVSFSAEGISSKSGSNCLKISGKTSMTLPVVEKNKYYLFSFYVYCKQYPPQYNYMNIKFNDRTQWSVVCQNSTFPSYSNVAQQKWSKVSFVIYSGNSTLFYISFGEGTAIDNANTFYIDDLSMIPLPENVQKAALTIDGYLGDYSVNDSYFASGVNDVFSNSQYDNLYSPVTGEKYSVNAKKMPALSNVSKTTPTDVENPELISKDSDSVCLKKLSEYEYCIEGNNWQDSNEFSGLQYGKYNFIQRKKSNEYFNSSISSKAITVFVVPLGDTNRDFNVNANDLAYLIKFLLGETGEIDSYGADTFKDNSIDILDLIRLKKILVQLNGKTV